MSQCNPYLLPIVAFKRALPGKLGNLIEGEFKHRYELLIQAAPYCGTNTSHCWQPAAWHWKAYARYQEETDSSSR